MIIIPNVNKENSCLDCPVWSLCWDNKPTEDISKDRCPIIEPKQGYWIKTDFYFEKCSNCGDLGLRGFRYCPNCGAKMDLTK